MEHAGHAIQAARTASGMSLRELARRSGTNAGYLSQVERGMREPTERWLEAVTRALADSLVEKSRAAS